MKKYTATTILPIIKIPGLAHKTKECWTANYIKNKQYKKFCHT